MAVDISVPFYMMTQLCNYLLERKIRSHLMEQSLSLDTESLSAARRGCLCILFQLSCDSWLGLKTIESSSEQLPPDVKELPPVETELSPPDVVDDAKEYPPLVSSLLVLWLLLSSLKSSVYNKR